MLGRHSRRGSTLEPKESAVVFNREVFMYRMMQDSDLAQKVAGVFLQDLPELMGTLKKRVAEKDIASIRGDAHKVKGAAANVGGEVLSELARKMEMASKAGDWETVTAQMPKLEEEAVRLREALEQWNSFAPPDSGPSLHGG